MTTETKNVLLGWGIIGAAFMLGNKYGYARRGLTRSFLFAFLDAKSTTYFMRNIVEFMEVIK